MNGYDNALVFKDIHDDDIKLVEKFIREETLGIITRIFEDTVGSECDVVIPPDEMLEYFGPAYRNNPDKFQFRPGDVKTIKSIVKHVKTIVDASGSNEGLKHFAKKKKIKRLNTAEQPERMAVNPLELNELKMTLSARLNDYLNGFNVDSSAMKHSDESICNVRCNGNTIIGEIFCVLCKSKKEETKPKRIHYNPVDKYWVLANFGKHLKKVHGLVSGPKSVVIEIKQVENSIQIDASHVNNVENPLQQKITENCVKFRVCEDDSITNRLFGQMSQQIQTMTQFILQNNDKEVEVQFDLNEDLTSNLKVIETIPDGDCLFSAIAHQLYQERIGSSQHRLSIRKLRAAVVDHIETHLDEYLPQLTERVLENGKRDEIEDMKKECMFFLKFCLSRDRYWGGGETVKAVSDLYQVNVIVYNECGPSYVINRCSKLHDRSIGIAYRLSATENGRNGNSAERLVRNHYDSISDMSTADLYTVAHYLNKLLQQHIDPNEIIEVV